eukprot:6455211-Amphidinium_carterae.1
MQGGRKSAAKTPGKPVISDATTSICVGSEAMQGGRWVLTPRGKVQPNPPGNQFSQACVS